MTTSYLREFFQLLRVDAAKMIFEWNLDVGKLGALLSRAHAIVSMRLDGCVLAHRGGRPVLGLGDDPTISTHFADIGRSSFLLSLDATAAEYREALESVISPQATLDLPTRNRISTLEVESQRTIDAFLNRLPHSPSLHRLTSPLPAVHSLTASSGDRWPFDTVSPLEFAPVPSPVLATANDPPPSRTVKTARETGVLTGGDFVRVINANEIGDADLYLDETPRWLLISGIPGTRHHFIFRTRVLPEEERSAAVVVFEIPGDSKEIKTDIGVLSKALGRYRLLPHGVRDGIVKLLIPIPEAGIMKLGFRTWKNKSTVMISHRFSIESGKIR